MSDIEERKLTGGEKRSKESKFKKLKKSKGDFEERYGKDAESVMHAVATKQAKNEDKDVTQGYMDHMKKVNKGEVNKYPMRGKGKPLSQARKDALFGKKKKDADYVEERVVDNPGRKSNAKWKPDSELANLRIKDIPSRYDQRKAYRDAKDAKNEDIGGEESVTNQRSQRILNLIRAKNPTAKNDFEAVLLSLDKAKKNLSNDGDQRDIAQLQTQIDGIDLQLNQLKGKVDGLNESATLITEAQFDEAAGEKDACYHKVKSRYKVWPSAYASGALVQCRKKGAANWGNSKKK